MTKAQTRHSIASIALFLSLGVNRILVLYVHNNSVLRRQVQLPAQRLPSLVPCLLASYHSIAIVIVVFHRIS